PMSSAAAGTTARERESNRVAAQPVSRDTTSPTANTHASPKNAHRAERAAAATRNRRAMRRRSLSVCGSADIGRSPWWKSRRDHVGRDLSRPPPAIDQYTRETVSDESGKDRNGPASLATTTAFSRLLVLHPAEHVL